MYGRSWCRASWTACQASRSARGGAGTPKRSTLGRRHRAVAVAERVHAADPPAHARDRAPDRADRVDVADERRAAGTACRPRAAPAPARPCRAAPAGARSGRRGRGGSSTRPGRSRRAGSRAVVCFTTRGPENESSAPGSAMMTSPSAAKLAATPPVVGWTSTETKGRPASRSSSTAATVFAICMSASTPSCMRAPPEAATDTSGMPPVEREVGGAGELLAHDRSHAAAQEREVHHRRAPPACRRSRPRRRSPRRADRSSASAASSRSG